MDIGFILKQDVYLYSIEEYLRSYSRTLMYLLAELLLLAQTRTLITVGVLRLKIRLENRISVIILFFLLDKESPHPTPFFVGSLSNL